MATPINGAITAKLHIKRDDLIGNIKAGREFNYQRQLAKLGQAIDRSEWGMSPQTVNAYYNPSSK